MTLKQFLTFCAHFVEIKENEVKEKLVIPENNLKCKQTSEKDLDIKMRIDDELSSKISSSSNEEIKDIDKKYSKTNILISSEIEDYKEEASEDNVDKKASYHDKRGENNKSVKSISGSDNIDDFDDEFEKFSDKSDRENHLKTKENKRNLSKQRERYNDSEEINDETNKSDSQSEDFEEESADYVDDYEDIQEDLEEGKNHGNEGDTSLEFEEYGIKFNN